MLKYYLSFIFLKFSEPNSNIIFIKLKGLIPTIFTNKKPFNSWAIKLFYLEIFTFLKI